MNNAVLLVVDVQTSLITEHPYNEHKVLSNIKSLILTARKSDTEVIYVQHNDGKGGVLEIGTEGWQIYNDIAPENGERAFDKQYNSSFFKTELKDYLELKKINTIILVGLQTEYCIDATCKSAFEHGYKVIIPEETNSTYDNEYLSGEELYRFYNFNIWNKRFADVLTIEEVERMIIDN